MKNLEKFNNMSLSEMYEIKAGLAPWPLNGVVYSITGSSTNPVYNAEMPTWLEALLSQQANNAVDSYDQAVQDALDMLGDLGETNLNIMRNISGR